MLNEKKIKHAEYYAAAVKGINELANAKVTDQLKAWARSERADMDTLTIAHGNVFLSSKTPNFWASCFVSLFPRGDCQEMCSARVTRLPSSKWAKCLLNRADAVSWRKDVEFVATLFNVFLRRDQMNKVEAHMKDINHMET